MALVSINLLIINFLVKFTMDHTDAMAKYYIIIKLVVKYNMFAMHVHACMQPGYSSG